MPIPSHTDNLFSIMYDVAQKIFQIRLKVRNGQEISWWVMLYKGTESLRRDKFLYVLGSSLREQSER